MHGLSLMRFPLINISNLREQNPTSCLTSPAIHVLSNITGVSFLKLLTFEVCMLSVFPLKIRTAIIHKDFLFSLLQCQLFLVVRIYFYIHMIAFLGNTYTSLKAYALDICQHAADCKVVALIVYHHL